MNESFIYIFISVIIFIGNSSPIRLPDLGVAKIYEIINAVNQPAGISYRVYEEGGSNSTILYLNNKEELTITPSTKDEVYRIIITGIGEYLFIYFNPFFLRTYRCLRLLNPSNPTMECYYR